MKADALKFEQESASKLYFLQDVNETSNRRVLSNHFYDLSRDHEGRFQLVESHTRPILNQMQVMAFSLDLVLPADRTFGKIGNYQPYIGCFRYPRGGGAPYTAMGLSFIGTCEIEDIGDGDRLRVIHYFWPLVKGGASVKIGISSSMPNVVMVFSKVPSDNKDHIMQVRTYKPSLKEPGSEDQLFKPQCV